MKVTLVVDKELQDAVQRHLDGGPSVQGYICAALTYFQKMLEMESKGNKCGYGDSSRFSTYNTEISPSKILESVE